MALQLASIGDYERLGNRRLQFLHRGYRVVVRHPPRQRDLDDFHPEDYTIGGRQQRFGDIVWLYDGDRQVGHVGLSLNIQESLFVAFPYGGLGPDSTFLGKTIDVLIDQVERWKDDPDPTRAVTSATMQSMALYLDGMTRFDGVPSVRRGK